MARLSKTLKNNLIFAGLRGMQAVMAAMPYSLATAVGGRLGAGFHALVVRERDRALANLALAFPELPEAARRDLTARIFVHVGRNLLEFLKMASFAPGDIARLVEGIEGREHMEAALARGRGVLCLTGHIGNWEILPVMTARHGWPTVVVAQRLYDARLDAILNHSRERQGVQVIQRGRVTRDIIRCLRDNKLLGVLNDQDTDVDARWAPFFGRPAKTPVGMFRLARSTGAAVVPVFIARQASGRHRIFIQPELGLAPASDPETALQEDAAHANRVIENFIRRFPDQWVWFHQRWKSAPPAAVRSSGPSGRSA